MNLYTAKEAKEAADKVVYESETGEVGRIVAKIKDASKKGCYSVSMNSISSGVATKLRSLGYKVNYWSDCRDNDSGYTISW